MNGLPTPGHTARIGGATGHHPRRLVSSTGSLVGTDLNVTAFDARTSRGEIAASFLRAPDHIDARIDAGNVRLTVPVTT